MENAFEYFLDTSNELFEVLFNSPTFEAYSNFELFEAYSEFRILLNFVNSNRLQTEPERFELMSGSE